MNGFPVKRRPAASQSHRGTHPLPIGERVGRLVIVAEHPTPSGVPRVAICKCDCYNFCTVKMSNLRKRAGCSITKHGDTGTVSCGCKKREMIRERFGCYLVSRMRHSTVNGKRVMFGTLVAGIRQRALRMGREWSVTNDYLWDLFISQGERCRLSGALLTVRTEQKGDGTASLDRIDSSMGYVMGNVWWVHKDLNKMKLNHPLDKFIEMCRMVAAHWEVSNELASARGA
jgi:hypothetical protein